MKIKSLIFLLLSGLCWGPSYLFIKIAVPHIPPLTLVFTRLGIAALLLYLFCRVQREEIFPWSHRWKQFALMGILLNAIPNSLISYGELYISSSLAGILNGLTLIFTAIIAHYFGMHDKLTKNKMIGICTGFAGLAIIYLPLVIHEGIKSGFGGLLIILSSVSYAIGTVYARTHLESVPILVALTSQLFIATLVQFPFSFVIEQPFSLPAPTLASILSAIALGVIGTAGGYFFYYKVIQLAGATYASLTVLLVPIIAMVLGALLLNEHLTWNLYLGTALILIGMLGVNPVLDKKA